MKENYDKKMTELLKDLPKGTPLLLHSCCAPCSSACLETLKEHFELTVFYYNPNIGDEAEYLKRKAEQIRFLKETGWAKLLDCDHDAAAFIGIARGLEEEPERGRRCYRCYKAMGCTDRISAGASIRRRKRKSGSGKKILFRNKVFSAFAPAADGIFRGFICPAAHVTQSDTRNRSYFAACGSGHMRGEREGTKLPLFRQKTAF